ncbi:MAG: hypothetical protein K8R21_12430 [Leptospira sp.]|nr:hypothetical protein [Leptospira sp.]
MKSGFEKYRNAEITILKPVSSTGELNALKKKTFAAVLSCDAYWMGEKNSETRGEAGEKQKYSALIHVQFDDLEEHDSDITQQCRIIKKKITEEENTWDAKDEWLIEQIRPSSRIDGFWIIEFEIYQPFEGNKVHTS